jgi:hypothetical protein
LPLLSRIHRDHTIRRFRAAAHDRYNEAIRLAAAHDRLAAIYLAGYVAEMCLKAAYFQAIGFSETQMIRFQDLQNARNVAINSLQLGWHGRNLHDLESWGNLLIAERQRRGMRYPPNFVRSLNARIRSVRMNWAPELRYQVNRPHRAEVRIVIEASTWFLGHHREL